MLTFDKLLQRRKTHSAPPRVSHSKRNGLLGMLAIAGAGYALKKFMTPDRKHQIGSKIRDVFSKFSGGNKREEASFGEGGYTQPARVPEPVPDIPLRGAY